MILATKMTFFQQTPAVMGALFQSFSNTSILNFHVFC